MSPKFQVSGKPDKMRSEKADRWELSDIHHRPNGSPWRGICTCHRGYEVDIPGLIRYLTEAVLALIMDVLIK